MMASMSIATTPFQCRALRRGGEGGHRREVDGDERRGRQHSENGPCYGLNKRDFG